MTHAKSALLVLLSGLIIGCAGSGPNSQSSTKVAYEQSETASRDEMQASGNFAADSIDAEANSSATASNPGKSAIQATRKIIYSCQIGLVVDNYNKFESSFPQLVATYGGFIASTDTDRRYQNNQSGTWIVRVPVDQYTSLLNGIHSLGFAESRSENAQDVTEEYVDVEARIKTKRQLEARILTMLEERTGKLSDVLEIERELARVREEVERMEGRIRFLKDRTSLATVTVQCREEQHYTPAAAPTLASRIHQSWTDSIASLRQVGESLLVGVISAAPWLLVFCILGILGRLATKRFWPTRSAT